MSLFDTPTESVGLYGNTVTYGGTYFEWFIFQEAASAPATPTGGSWNFLTNVGTAPSGWSTVPPANPTNTVWASIAIVNSRDSSPLVWSTPASWTKPGTPGTSATVAVGTTTTSAPGGSASVTNSGTSTAAVFDFTIPRGDTGPAGASGTNATVTAGTTTTGAAGTSASVVNSGTTSNAIFDFTIPRGDTGAAGTAATVAVGTTTTGAAGSSASVTNSGTSSAATFNFTIPRGDTGAAGATGATGLNWLGAWSSSTTYAVRDAVSYLGSSYYAIAASTNQPPAVGAYWDLLALKGTDGSGSGTVTSVGVTAPAFLSVSGSPVTAAGTIALNYSGTALPVANGGTGATTAGGALTSLGAIGSVASADGSVTVSQVGSAVDLSVAVAAATNNVICQVRNTTGATLTKGTAVYISGATGQIPTVSKALANSDATSAQTLGLITADLANNSNGNVTIIGLITNVDTSAYTDGAQLYLSGTTAGTLTATKPYAPTHLVYVAVVEYAHATQGKLFVKVQNGYELDELHNVSAQTPTTGQTIVYNSATSLWEQNTVSLTAGVNGTLPVANGGTGVTTSTGSGNVVLSTSPTLVTPVLGTPTSATLTNATGLPLSTGVTGTLPIANGGTGVTTTPANGSLLIGNGTGYTNATLTAGSNITITNSSGGISIAATSSGGVTTGKSIAMAMIFGF